MSVLTADEQSLFDVAKAALPRELFHGEGDPNEHFYATAKIAGAAKAQVDGYLTQTRIKDSTGVWLDQHAKDRNTRRQAGETDPALRDRLRLGEEFVTIGALIRNNVLDIRSQGTAGATSYGYTVVFDDGTGKLRLMGVGTITTGNATLSGTNYNRIRWITLGGGIYSVYRTAGGASHGLIGTVDSGDLFDDTGLAGDGATVPANLLPAIAEGAATQVLRANGRTIPAGYPAMVEVRGDKVFMGRRGYMSRGYRMGARPPINTAIIILPYGSTASDASAIAEAVRQRKGAGIVFRIERRLNP